MKKVRLYSSSSGWENRHASVMEALGLPNGGSLRYAEKIQVDNENHADYEKFIFPIQTSGDYKCDHLFSGELVDWDENWFTAEEP